MNISNRSRILTLSILAPLCIGAASGQGDTKMPDIKIDPSPLPQSAPSYAPVVESQQGEGTTVTVRIPIARGPSEAAG